MDAIVETFFLVLLLGWEALKWIGSTLREGFFYGVGVTVLYYLILLHIRLQATESLLKQINEKLDAKRRED